MLTKPAAKPKAKKPAARIIKKKPEDESSLIYGTYFGKHNNADITIIPSVNFEEDMLKYCLTNNQNKEIAKMIIKMVPLEKFKFIYYRPMLGNLVMNLFDTPQITTGYLAENEYLEFLTNNIVGYGLEKNVIIEPKITKIPESVLGQVAILQLDPKVDLENEDSYTVNNIPLFDLLDKLYPIMSLIVLILPKDVEIDYEGMTFPQFTVPANVGFLVSEEGQKLADKLGLPKKKNDKESEDIWYGEVVEHLRYLFTKKLKIKNVDQMLDPKYRKIWMAILTHDSFDPNNHYQEHETTGDFILKGIFGVFMSLSMPHANKNELTMFNQHFMSKHFQPKLTKDLGLDEFIRSRDKIDNSTLEDVFESFVSGYFTVSMYEVGLDKAYGRIHHLIEYLFNKVEKINFNELRKSELKLSSMQIKQILEGLRSKYFEKATNVAGGVQVVITIPDRTVDYLRKRGKNVDRIIGQGYAQGNNKDIASRIAFDNAVAYLAKMGITESWVLEEKERMNKLDPLVAHLEEEITRKKKLQKYINIYHKVDAGSCTIYLYGIDQANNHTLIGDINDCDIDRGIVKLYEDFIAQ